MVGFPSGAGTLSGGQSVKPVREEERGETKA